MNDEQSRRDPRKPYQRPEVNRFPLRPEEATLGFCKSSASAGPSGGSCRNVNPCNSMGS